MTPQDKARIARINEISALARTSWIGLLAYLAFVFAPILAVPTYTVVASGISA